MVYNPSVDIVALFLIAVWCTSLYHRGCRHIDVMQCRRSPAADRRDLLGYTRSAIICHCVDDAMSSSMWSGVTLLDPSYRRRYNLAL